MEENRKWRAKWIWTQGCDGTQPASIGRFRKTFELPNLSGKRFVARVTADSRYKLYANGRYVTAGPCKGDDWTHYYETIDLTSYMREGMNVLAVLAVHYPPGSPAAPASVWRSRKAAFLLEGTLERQSGQAASVPVPAAGGGAGRPGDEGETRLAVVTDEGWQAMALRGVSFVPDHSTLFVGYPEDTDGSAVCGGWERPDYDARGWPAAVVVSDAYDPMWGGLTPWQLTPRPIPLLEETPRRFRAISRIVAAPGGSADDCAQRLIRGERVRFGANERWAIEWDAGELTTGYIRLQMAGGAGSVMRLRYAECYEPEPGPDGKRRKAVRDRPEGQVLIGPSDRYAVAGTGGEGAAGGRSDGAGVDSEGVNGGEAAGEDAVDAGRGGCECYEPFWWRTFRYIRMEIETHGQPLELVDFAYRETGYPLVPVASFEASDPDCARMWEVSVRTLRLCMHETYEDCPFYEQMQYPMDTRLQALFTYRISGDDRLARRAIHDFHSSLTPSGMVQSRYPSMNRQIIPGFALHWIWMVADHYDYYADRRLVSRYRPTVDAVLDWFERRIDDDGVVGPVPEAYWSFSDWVGEWEESSGVPPHAKGGRLSSLSFMYAIALDRAAVLTEATGRPDTAAEYRRRRERVLAASREQFWSPGRRLFRDGDSQAAFSQHAQIWAVLSGAIGGGSGTNDDNAAELMERTLADRSLAQVSYAMTWYLFRALSATGLYARVRALWEPWRDQLALNLTTWAEDALFHRSDCHGWSSLPLYEFTAELLGVKAALPGFEVILIAPQPGSLRFARGTVATPKGDVAVAWCGDGRQIVEISGQGPEGVPLAVRLPGMSEQRWPDGGHFRISLSN